MRAVVQRVTSAQVTVNDDLVGQIGAGLCVFVGVVEGDLTKDAFALAKKVACLRIFNDTDERMNLSVVQTGGAVLAVSQFTLAGDVRKGNRPAFTTAMAPQPASELFDLFCCALRDQSVAVATGRFRTNMLVSLVNDGPVTILLDTHRAF